MVARKGPLTGVSIAEAARQIGVSEAALRKARKAGRIDFEPDGSVDVAKVARTLRADWAHRQANGGRGSIPAAAAPVTGYFSEKRSEPLYQARATIETRRAEMLELELAEKRGELLRREDVELAFAGKLSAAREAFLSVASRLAPIVAAETDPNKVHDLIEAEMKAALRLLSKEAPRPAS